MNKKLLLLLAFICLFTCFYGKTPFNDVWDGVIMRLKGHSSDWNPLLDERIPRIIVILCTGASLAVSGAVMQALFQNPLASPSVLGISCGGSLMVIPVFIMGLHVSFPYLVPMIAFIGSLFTLMLVYNLARKEGQIQMTNLILTGIAVSTLFISIQGALLYALRDHWQLIQLITEWEAGSTVDRTWSHVHMQLPITLVGLFGCWHYRTEINLLMLGEEEALNLGVEVSKVRWRLFVCVALLIGGSLAALGVILFFGLVLPHIVRAIFGSNFMNILPFCANLGACSLLTMDLILRVFDIHALSIGNISAILGGVFFLLILIYNRSYAESY